MIELVGDAYKELKLQDAERIEIEPLGHVLLSYEIDGLSQDGERLRWVDCLGSGLREGIVEKPLRSKTDTADLLAVFSSL